MAFLLIVLLCYVVVALLRKTKLPNESLPLISGSLGLLLSLLTFYVFPTIVPAQDLGVTMLYGLLCGLAATGSNQVFKQTVKYIASKYKIAIAPLIDVSTDDSDKKEG